MSKTSKEAEDEMLLSLRGKQTADYKDFLFIYKQRASADPYDALQNPHGIINMGTAQSHLMAEELTQQLSKSSAFTFSKKYQQYYDFSGIPELKEAIANFLTRHLNPHKQLLPEYIVVMPGATSCIDALAHALCDRGDVIITPTPSYGCIFRDVNDHAGVIVEPLNLVQDGDSKTSFILEPEALRSHIQSLKASGHRVRAFILLHPNNPLGDVYAPELLHDLMDVCAREKIHFISDEVYALSVFDEGPKFRSVLSLEAPDPERTHVIWSFSKDFNLAGLRVGVIVNVSPLVTSCLRAVAEYKSVPHIIQHAAATLLNDAEWCDKFYLPMNRARLAKAYKETCKRLEIMGAHVRKARAGFFVWFSVQPFMMENTEKEEMALHEEIMDAGLYIAPGTKFYCISPGWMRLVFTVPKQELNEGLRRLEGVLRRRQAMLKILKTSKCAESLEEK